MTYRDVMERTGLAVMRIAALKISAQTLSRTPGLSRTERACHKAAAEAYATCLEFLRDAAPTVFDHHAEGA